jgi:hypothetical protein
MYSTALILYCKLNTVETGSLLSSINETVIWGITDVGVLYVPAKQQKITS